MNEATDHSKNLLLEGKSGPWEMVIGIEVHCPDQQPLQTFFIGRPPISAVRQTARWSNIDAAFSGHVAGDQ